MARNCENCTEECSQAKRAHQAALGRMYSTREFITLLKKVESGELVEVVHGRWREKILVGGFAMEWGFVCSECGCTVSDRSNLGVGRYASNNQRLNYCPNCGAKMDGDGNE